MRKELKKWMVDNELSNKMVANKMGISESSISAIVQGKRNASIKLLSKFNEVFEIGSMDKTIELFKDE